MPIQVITDTNDLANDGGNLALNLNSTLEISSTFTDDTKIEINLILKNHKVKLYNER